MLKTEWIFCGIWLIAGLGMLRCYLSRKRPLRSALLGMLTGVAALTLMHLYGGRFGVEMPLNCFTGGISLLLGVPGVTLLTVLLLI